MPPKKVIAVIPARFASIRLPGKPLLDKTGKTLIQHTFENTSLAKNIEAVIVATDDERIFEAVKNFGGAVEMTRNDHRSGTDRVLEVAEKFPEAEIIINVQGDEPSLEPEALNRLVTAMLENEDCDSATLAAPLAPKQVSNPSCVKVVSDVNGNALYFSRSAIPFDRSNDKPGPALLHVGVYVFRRKTLFKFSKLPQSPLEKMEKLEQLRLLENGFKMKVIKIDKAPIGIDTPTEYETFVREQGAKLK